MKVDIKMNLPPDESVLPKNVKQIGEVQEGDVTVYIEDYVYTYLYQLIRSENFEEQVALLVGKRFSYQGEEVILISGTMRPIGVDIHDQEIKFSKDTWDHAEKERAEYFGTKTLVGWMHNQPSGLFKSLHHHSIHERYFSNNGQVLLLMDPVEKEEHLYYWKDDDLERLSGFFIYYDRNVEMHSYMLDHKVPADKDEWEVKVMPRPQPKEEPVENKSYRSHREQKAHKNVEKGEYRVINMMVSLSAVLFILCLIMGYALIQNDRRIQLLEEGLAKSQEVLSSMEPSVRESSKVSVTFDQQEQDKKRHKEAVDQAEVDNQSSLSTDPIDVQEIAVSNIPVQDDVVIEIPESCEIEYGQSLGMISEKYYGTVSMVGSICELNGIDDPNKIKQGMVILLPQP